MDARKLNQRNGAAGVRLGRKRETINFAKAARENGKKLWQQRRRKQWQKLDWDRTDKQLGREMEVSWEWARQMRRDLGKPGSARQRPRQLRLREAVERAKA